MLIDWFTVGAQALNFLILVWLLKRFLYQPILQAIDAREKRISSALTDAAAKQSEANKEREEFQHKNEEFDRQRAERLTRATGEVAVERQRLLDEARMAADALSLRRQEALKSDVHELKQSVTRRTQKEVFAIARKVLTDLATASLEERMAAVFLRRLKELDAKTKAGFDDALKTASGPALVRSAFDLLPEQRAAIQTALDATFSVKIPVRFEVSPELVSGIEFTANGQKLGWSITEYLESLEKSVGDLLEEKDTLQAKIAPDPEFKAEPRPNGESGATPVPKVEADSGTRAKPEPVAKVDGKSKAKVES